MYVGLIQRTTMLLQCVASVCCILAASSGSINLEYERKTWKSHVALRGENVQITCSDDAQWYYWSVDENQTNRRKFIISGMKNYYSKANESIVHFNSVELSDAGTYECSTQEMIHGTTGFISKKIFNQLTVIDSQKCKTNSSVLDNSITVLELHGIEMQCSLEYRGNLSLTMEWRRNDKTTVIQGVIVDNQTSRIVSTLRITANPEDKDSYFTCTTRLGATSNKTSVECVNMLECKLFWESPTINVLYSPRNAAISPNKSSFNHDEPLTCLADANPKAEYHWMNTKSGEVLSGQTLKVDKTMNCRETCSYECTARNQHGSDQAFVSFSVNAGAGSYSISTVCAIVIPVILGLVVTYLVAVFCVYRRKITAISDRISIDGMSQKTLPSLGAHKVCHASIRKITYLEPAMEDGTQSVKSGRSDKYNTNKSGSSSECYTVVGRDGTIYSELNIRGAGACCGVPPKNQQFDDNQSHYAHVDHIAKPPTPPPKQY